MNNQGCSCNLASCQCKFQVSGSIGNAFVQTSTATASNFTFNDGYGPRQLVGVNTTEETIEILYKRESTIYYTHDVWNGTSFTNSKPNDQAIKEIYGVVDGKLTLIKTVIGVVKPAHYVDEELEFPE